MSQNKYEREKKKRAFREFIIGEGLSTLRNWKLTETVALFL